MAINWQGIYKKYKGLWVALKDDERTVVGSGKTAQEALKKAKSKGVEHPILTHVPEKLLPFAGFAGNEIQI